MTESLPRPWILEYWTEIAEKYGANIMAAPVEAKKKKAQLIDYITYPKDDDDVIWVQISDKHFEVPVKMSVDAIRKYNNSKSTVGTDRRITQQRFAICFISKFKPFFARIPLSRGQGMDKVERLALEVGEISFVGAQGESIFGDPKDLECDEDLREYVKGLREGGGEGNILKLAKTSKGTIPVKNGMIGPKNSKSSSASNDIDQDQVKTTKLKSRPKIKMTPLEEYKQSWKAIEDLYPIHSEVPKAVLELVRGLEINQGLKPKFDEMIFDDLGRLVYRGRDEYEVVSLIPNDVKEATVKEADVEVQELKKLDSQRSVRQTTPPEWPPSDDPPNEEEVQSDVIKENVDSSADSESESGSDEKDELDDETDWEDVDGIKKNEDQSQAEEDEMEVDPKSKQQDASQIPIISLNDSQSPLRPPTPAQRSSRRQSPESENDLPPSSPPPYHKKYRGRTDSREDEAVVEETLLVPDSQPNSTASQSQSQSQSHRKSYVDNLEVLAGISEAASSQNDSVPIVLVPDSDVSANMSSLTQSQSHSQSQNQQRNLSRLSEGSPILKDADGVPNLVKRSQKSPQTILYSHEKSQSTQTSSGLPSQVDDSLTRNTQSQIVDSSNLGKAVSQKSTTTTEEDSQEPQFVENHNEQQSPKVERQTDPHELLLNSKEGAKACETASSEGSTSKEYKEDVNSGSRPPRVRRQEGKTPARKQVSPLTSPTAHLGKRPRASVPSISESPLRKVPKLSSSGGTPRGNVKHDMDAWQQPTFMRTTKKQVTEEAPSSSGKIKHDPPPRDLVLRGSTTKTNETKSSASYSTPDLLKTRNAEASSSRIAATEKKSEHLMATSVIEVPPALLGGYKLDITLQKLPDSPQWYNWQDIQALLLKVGRWQHQQANEKGKSA